MLVCRAKQLEPKEAVTISLVNVILGILLVGEFWEDHFITIQKRERTEIREQKFHDHTQAAWLRRKYMAFVQATVYLIADQPVGAGPEQICMGNLKERAGSEGEHN